MNNISRYTFDEEAAKTLTYRELHLSLHMAHLCKLQFLSRVTAYND